MHLVINLTKVNATYFNGDLTATRSVVIPSYPLNPSNVTNKAYVDSSINVLNANISAHINNSIVHLTDNEHSFLSGITITNEELNNASGITDDVQAQIDAKANKSGDTLTGYLTLLSDPINSDDLATKSYIDKFSDPNFSQFSTGDLILYPSSITPNGFLKCNGSIISRTTYNKLFSALGYTYTYNRLLAYDTAPAGVGQPWKQQYSISTNNSLVDLGTWSSNGTLPYALYNASVVVTLNRVYLIGGQTNNTTFLNSVYYAPINSDGTLGSWVNAGTIPVSMARMKAVVGNKFVYLIGGYTGNGLNSVYYAPINSDGSLGSWSPTTILPISGLYWTQVYLSKSRIYVLGGYNNNSLNSVYYAPINSDGTLGSWVADVSLPISISQSQIAFTGNNLYLIGGYNTEGAVASVYYAPINSDGSLGVWSVGPTLPTATYAHQVYVTSNYIYVIGGSNNLVYYAAINSNGMITNWVSGTNLPSAITSSQLVATKSNLYLIGNTSNNTIYSANTNSGKNDYSAYYDFSRLVDSQHFALPDFTVSSPMSTLSYYIKD
jgi:N-acetylneuraminic acid mutarotase